jgi:prophage antirepressor-like protein
MDMGTGRQSASDTDDLHVDAGCVLSPLHFQDGSIRSAVVEGKPWFVSADVCETLDLKNPRDALRRLGSGEKGKVTIQTAGGPQQLSVVNESGLYCLAFTSRKPEAEAFRFWVTDEVLPSLRRAAAGQAQPTDASDAYVRVPWHGEFHVSFKEDGNLSIVPDENRIDQFYLLELEALAHASCLVGKLWNKFELLDEVGAHSGEGSNTRFQLDQAISQIQHIAVSAMRTQMEMQGDSSGTNG